MQSRSTLQSMVRCGVSSLVAVAVEFGLLTLLVSVFHVFYLLGSIAAGVVYFFINFAMNRRWAFRAGNRRVWPQMLRHGFVAGSGTALGTLLLWLFVSGISLPYQVGWLCAGTLGFFGWTYPLHRWFTYREPAVALSSAG